MAASLPLAHATPTGVSRVSRPLRVLDITDFYSETASGGVKTYLHAKAAALAEHGIRHSLIVPGERTEVDRLGDSRIYRIRGPSLAASKSYRVMLSTAAVREVLRNERPDVIEVGSPFIVPHLLRRAGADACATVGFYHADIVRTFAEPYVPNRFAAPLRVVARVVARRLIRRVYRGFDVTVAASASVADELRSLGVPDVRTVGLGVDLELFRPLPAHRRLDRSEWGAEPGVPVGIYVGRFCAEKRLDVLLEGHARIPLRRRPHLLLVGDGPHRARLEALAHTRPRVRLFPYVADRHELARLYASADFYAAPGPGETFGLSIAEAMACGLPVVVVNRGAGPDRVADSGTGEAYEHGDPAGAALALERMAARSTPELRERARRHAERTFGWDATFSALVALYREVTAGVHT